MDGNMRRLIAFPCEGERLVGTLDEALGTTGLLIVSGGNEIRIGAHRGMALLAQRLTAEGVPVFRFDRRGIGDSTGENRGYASSAPDIAAAAAAFREHAPHVRALVAFGNCDAATALVLFSPGAGIDRLILANPWVVEEEDDLPPAAAIRARYAERLGDPRQWLRLATGKVSISKLASGLRKISSTRRDGTNDLAKRVFSGLAETPPARIILAEGDATAIAFRDAACRAGYSAPITSIDTASHSFARPEDADALVEAVVGVLRSR
jgi:exosortase A-associated hydrolase 1